MISRLIFYFNSDVAAVMRIRAVLLFLLCFVCVGGQIRGDLHAQRLSHFAFHSSPFKVRLARLLSGISDGDNTDTDTGMVVVVVVGVEWGKEVFALAEAGMRVVGVESDSRYTRYITSKNHPNIAMHHCYAGATNTAIDENEPAGTKTARLDSILPGDGEVGVLSIDVQGAEYEVLQGASALLEKGLIRSLVRESP